jgi:hypothetical protein
MCWKFYGYACVYGQVDIDCDIFLTGRFSEFLTGPGHLGISDA